MSKPKGIFRGTFKNNISHIIQGITFVQDKMCNDMYHPRVKFLENCKFYNLYMKISLNH